MKIIPAWWIRLNGVLLLGTSLFTAALVSAAPNNQFFRLTGSVATKITAFRADGTLVWTNTPTNTTFTIQTATSLKGGTNWVDYVQVPASNSITTNRVIDFHPPAGMTLIPAGSFTMGNSVNASEGFGDELPLHTVSTTAFYLDQNDVTAAQWNLVYQWAIAHGYSFDNAGSGAATNHPVQTVDWYDAVKWCNARSELAKKLPAYYTSAAQTTIYQSGQINVDNNSVKWNAGYRLPTEAEWEKSARGGLKSQRFPWGNTISWNQANYDAMPGGYDVNPIAGDNPMFGDTFTSPAGYFAPNGYGLYDMAGNVSQWCWDWYGSYASSLQTDPHGPTTGSARLIRGGDWNNDALYGRSSVRYQYPPVVSAISIGFRSVLPAGQ